MTPRNQFVDMHVDFFFFFAPSRFSPIFLFLFLIPCIRLLLFGVK